MIFITDSTNSQSWSWPQNIARDGLSSESSTDFKQALPPAQTSSEAGSIAHGKSKLAGAESALAHAHQYFKDQISAQSAAQSDSTANATDLGIYGGEIKGEFTYKNEKGEWVTEPLIEHNSMASFKGVVTKIDNSDALLSVLNSLVFGTPMSAEAQQYLSGPGTFIKMLGLPRDELEYAKENPEYVIKTPLGNMTYKDLEQLDDRIKNYAQNPNAATRNLALEVLQDINERQDELEEQYAQQTPFDEIWKAQQLAATDNRDQDEQEQVDAQVQAKVEHLEEQHDIQAQVNKLRSADHEEDQDFLNTLKFSYDLLRN